MFLSKTKHGDGNVQPAFRDNMSHVITQNTGVWGWGFGHSPFYILPFCSQAKFLSQENRFSKVYEVLSILKKQEKNQAYNVKMSVQAMQQLKRLLTMQLKDSLGEMVQV